MQAFVIQSQGFGDDEDVWDNVGIALSLRSARKAVVRLQNGWDRDDSPCEDPREVRRNINWRPSFRYKKLDVLEM